MEDEKIVALYWTRDERAITLSKEKYEHYLYTIALNILASLQDAEESVSDTYVGAWNSIPPHKPVVLRTYLGRITRNLSLKRYRYLHAEKRHGGEMELALDELSEVVADTQTAESEAERRELIRSIHVFLASLSSDQRMIFLMRYWHLHPVAVIAKKLGYSQSKVKMTLKRTRDSLRDSLKEEGLL